MFLIIPFILCCYYPCLIFCVAYCYLAFAVSFPFCRKIHATGEITDADVNQLYMIVKPVCQGCRVNTKDNPNCFCALIPPPNGSRKSGLWQKTTEILLALGPDPSKDLRTCASSPAGLTNLGATCYANSILQCLYMNKSFREGVFSVEPDVLKQQPVLAQLARLFAQLHASKMAFIDSAPFIKTLELDNGVQQDSHEFLTLLLSLLERCLSHSRLSRARTIVQDLFRGRVSHVTTYVTLSVSDFYFGHCHQYFYFYFYFLHLASFSVNPNDKNGFFFFFLFEIGGV